MVERPAWTISRAANECAVSRDTIKRRRAAGAFPNAFQNSQRQWVIPVSDLIAAGLRPGTPKTGDEAPAVPQGNALGHEPDAPGARPRAAPDESAELRTQIEFLQVRLDAESRLRIAAEQNASDLRTSLRMLESGLSTVPDHVTDAPSVPASPLRRSRWWRR